MKAPSVPDTRIRFRASIAVRLWVAMMALVLVVLVILWLFQVVFLQEFYGALRISTTAADTDVLADTVARSSSSQSVDAIDAFSYRTGTAVELYDREGILQISAGSSGEVGGRGQQGAWNAVRLKILPDVLAGSPVQATMMHPRLGVEFVVVGRPVRVDGVLVGALLVTLPMPAVDEAAEVLKVQLFWISLILTIVAIILALLFARTFSRPIRILTEAARRMADGRFDTEISLHTRDEIGELAEALRRMAQDLSRVEGLRREFIANMSHELRTPLTLIRGYAETLRDLEGAAPETKRRQLDRVIAESMRLARLVDDLLDLSRMQSESIHLEPSVFPLDQLASRVLEQFQDHARSVGMTLVLEAPPACLVKADEARIEQVLYNLVQNALQHGLSGGTAIVRVFRIKDLGNVIRCEVADDGPGIPPEEQAGIWERFRRGKSGGDRDPNGTGLGLAIVRSILQAHGAPHGVRSETGAGAVFWFDLTSENLPSPFTLSSQPPARMKT